MQELSAVRKIIQDQNDEEKQDLKIDLRAMRTKSLRDKASGMGVLKIRNAEEAEEISTEKAGELEKSSSETVESIRAAKIEKMEYALKEAASVTLSPLAATAPKKQQGQNSGLLHKTIYAVACLLTFAWTVYCIAYGLHEAGRFASFGPSEVGMFLAGVLAPPALLWVAVSSLMRRADLHYYTLSLRGELQSLLFPSGETSRLINSDIQAFVNQAQEISATTNEVLKSLQRARYGLRTELKDFATLSKKAEFHIGRLSDSLHQKTEKLLTITDEVGKRVNMIDEKALNGITAWEDAALKMAGRADAMESAMDKGTTKILEAADKAGDRTREIEGNFTRIGEKLDGDMNKLSGIIETMESKAGKFSDVIASGKAGIEDTEKAVAKLEEATQALASCTGNLDDMLENKASELRETVTSISREIESMENTGRDAGEKISEAVSAAVAGTKDIEGAIKGAVESLEKSAETARSAAGEITDKTRASAENFRDAGEENAAKIKETLALLEESRKAIDDTAKVSFEKMCEFREAMEEQRGKMDYSVSGLSGRVSGLSEALTEPLSKIDEAVKVADERHQAISNILRARIEELNDSSEKAGARAETIRTSLKIQAQEISALSGQVAGQAGIIKEQFAAGRETLSGQVSESLAMIGKVSDALKESGGSIGKISLQAVTDVTGLGDKISASSHEISSITQKVCSDLGRLDEILDSKMVQLGARSEDATQSVLRVRDALEATASSMDPVLTKTIEKAGVAQQEYAALKESLIAASETGLSRIQQAGNVFEQKLDDLRAGAEHAESLLEAAASKLQEGASGIESASQMADEKLVSMARAIKGQASDMHLSADQMLLKMESVQKAINEQFLEFSASVGQFTAQMQETGRDFTRNASLIREGAKEVHEGFEEAGQSARVQSEALEKTAEKTSGSMHAMTDTMRREMEEMLASAQVTLDEIRKAGESFALRARELTQNMKESLHTSESFSRELKTQAATVADLAGHSAERLSKAVVDLSSKVDDMGRTAKDVAGQIENTAESMGIESERLIHVSSAALETAREAALSFGKQSESLFKASQDAKDFMGEIDSLTHRARTDAFMAGAKFVVESLHSLSVDVTRLLDGNVSEKSWRAFQSGDVGIFTRKLARLGDTWPTEKAQEKFEKDSEFRTFVLRYIRQFEELYEQVESNDHNALLATTMGSSDVAKLYGFLCAVAKRDSVLGKNAAKAA